MEWRILNVGELIQAGDETDACADSWRDEPVWKPVHPESIGKPAPDPSFPAHRLHRRRCPPPTIVAPWDARAAELEDTEGTYAHYAAWEEWWLDRVEEEPCLEEIDAEIARPFLFAAFSKAIEESRIEVPNA